jgi:hypothetical protein
MLDPVRSANNFVHNSVPSKSYRIFKFQPIPLKIFHYLGIALIISGMLAASHQVFLAY